MYRTLDTSFWTDPKTGKRIKILSNRYRMRYPKVHSHAVIRAFVHTRDDFTCQVCGRRSETPSDYDGRTALVSTDGVLIVVDHKISLQRGGTNHPDNLQTLCDPCNARKFSLAVKIGRKT